MTKPIIGVTTGEVVNLKFAWSPHVYGQNYTYVDAIKVAGGIPVLLPFLDDPQDVAQIVSSLDGVLFSGGNDITPEIYAEPVTHARETSRERDEWELSLMSEAQKQHKPVLAICRGLQLLNVSRGGTLYQDILLDRHSAENHQSSEEFEDITHLSHSIKIDASSKLASILGMKNLKTNTFHHQAVKKLGRDLLVVARSEDGVIEAIEDPSELFVVAVQSHPESLFNSTEPTWAKLFTAFTESCK